MPTTRHVKDRLDVFFNEVSSIILSRQNPATGLDLVRVRDIGSKSDLWMRADCGGIGTIGLNNELEHATVKCMRGLLFCMMRQAHKVELFKSTQYVEHALHAKYNTATGDTVVGDREWGHLQIDATSLFLLQLAQMTASGTRIIFTMDEVNFVQNLVFYIERAYRTPDYGIWERGDKINHGQPELNSSSIGMAVAALQAVNGLNLFGSRGGASSVIHVLPDEITRNYTTLHSALPRESNSKEVDAAVLSVISYPAFAVGDSRIVSKTRNEIVKKLGGRFGFKRFLRDGHQTVLEDTSRLHYDPHELKIFSDIECEWPLFFTYMVLDGFFRDDKQQIEDYRRLLEPLLVDSSLLAKFHEAEHHAPPPPPQTRSSLDRHGPRSSIHGRRPSAKRSASRPPAGTKLVPELYIVPRDRVADEKAEPGSVQRVPNENIPLVWAQSLHIIGSLLHDDLLSPGELDPLGRRFLPYRPKLGTEVVVQVVLLAENADLQAKLATFGLETQTMEACSPVTISPPSALRDAYMSLGENSKLGLTGRPKRPIGTLSTSKLYRCQGRLYAFLPHFMDKEEFYLVSDNNYLVSLFEQEIAFVKNHWWSTGRPTMVIMLTREMLGGIKTPSSKTIVGQSDNQRWRYNSSSNSKRNLMNFMMSLRSGNCNGVRVRVGRLQEMVNTACIESLDFLVSKDHYEVDEWHSLLQGEWQTREAGRKLHLSEQQAASGSEKPHGSQPRSRSVRRRSSGDLNGSLTSAITPSKSPLKSPYYTEDPPRYDSEFKLRDHVEEMSKLELGPSAKPPIGLSPNTSGELGSGVNGGANGHGADGNGTMSPVMRAKSPIRGLSSNRLTRGSFADGTTSTGANPKGELAAIDGHAPLSRRNSYSFDVTDETRGKTGKVSVDVSGLDISANGTRMSPSMATPAPMSAISATFSLTSPVSATDDSKLPFDEGPSLADILTLTLHDNTHVGAAISLLKSSANLYDQIDLLHYLHSCLGPDHVIEGLGAITLLLEEVYVKAMGMKLWSIVRQAAGLLKKMVNSLTINVTDLLIRSKPVTVGFGQQEFTIMNPLSPEALSEIIYRHCASDVREAPLVQEIITYLGSLVRSNASLFDGIQRVRTYFFVIAMREEISRMKGCDEEEAIELLMQNGNAATSTTASGMPTVDARLSNASGVMPSTLTIAAQSGGFSAGNFARVEVGRDDAAAALPGIFGRGLNVVVMDPLDGSVVETTAFDTHISQEESEEFAKMVEWLEPGMIVVIVAKDDAAENLTEAARAACESLGSSRVRDLHYRDSWCLIGEKGAERGSMPESLRSTNQGPTENIQRTIDLVTRRKKMLASLPSQSQARLLSIGTAATLLMPSNGRWLRRRKNDGALNRVPPDFYPKVWHVLSKCHGIAIGREFLPRDPTVSEKTPEEHNFALQIEYLLDVIRDPAERQIAVECLVVISRISERNPEIRISSGPLDLMRVIRDAVSRFWCRWVNEQSPGTAAAFAYSDQQQQQVPADGTTPGLGRSPTNPNGLVSVTPTGSQSNLSATCDLTFDRNERLARRLFFDLAQDGKEGTMSYLAESCVRLCFDVQWGGEGGVGRGGRKEEVTVTP
ncbi:hypothetical protein HK101_009545 [Irineochytrium annulatum]|nr:hypothetical protein HK101_009545 [Irineochytrium annulatum]